MHKKLKILLIDDELDILDILSDEFIFRGHYCTKSLSGNEAIEILKLEHFDVVVSDFKMSNGNGTKVLEFVTTLSSKPKFYLMYGQLNFETDHFFKLGCQHFFSKPFDMEYLVKKVEEDFI